MQGTGATSTASPEHAASAAAGKRPATGDRPGESDTDRLIAALLQDRAEARVQAEAQRELLAQSMALQQRQLQELANLRRVTAANASSPDATARNTTAIGAAAAPTEAAAAPATGGNTLPPVKLTSAIKTLVEAKVDAAKAALTTAKRAHVAADHLQKLDLNTDPSISLPEGSPKDIRRIAAPKIKMPDGIEDDKLLEETAIAIDTCTRATQIAYVAQLLRTKERTIEICHARLSAASDSLSTELDTMLADTALTAAYKQKLKAAALLKFGEERDAAVFEIETARIEAIRAAAEKARLLEEAKLLSLETDNSQTIGALVDAKIAANELRRRGSDAIDLEEEDEMQLRIENAEAQKQLFHQAPQSSAHSARGRNAKSQTRKPKKPGKKPAARGKANGRGKGKNRKGGGRGGN
eukprot:SAG11_NODE_2873_length_2880_cov_9.311399_2_plen_411_part_00